MNAFHSLIGSDLYITICVTIAICSITITLVALHHSLAIFGSLAMPQTIELGALLLVLAVIFQAVEKGQVLGVGVVLATVLIYYLAWASYDLIRRNNAAAERRARREWAVEAALGIRENRIQVAVITELLQEARHRTPSPEIQVNFIQYQ